MKIDVLIKFAESYLAAYFRNFAGTFITPGNQFSTISVRKNIEEYQLIISGSQKTVIEINPKLFSFLILNIFVGTSLLNISFPEFAKQKLVGIFVTTIFLWFVASTTIFLAFRVFKTKNTFLETITIGMQLFSVIYVVACFFTVLWTSIVSTFELKNQFREYIFFSKPIFLYFAIQTLFLLFYIPFTFKNVYKINFLLSIFVGFVTTLAWVFTNILLFVGAGEIRPPMMAFVPNKYVIVDVSGSMDSDLLGSCLKKIDPKILRKPIVVFNDNVDIVTMGQFYESLTNKKLIGGGTNFNSVLKYFAIDGERIDELYLISDLAFGNREKKLPVLTTEKLFVFFIPPRNWIYSKNRYYNQELDREITTHLDGWINPKQIKIYNCLTNRWTGLREAGF